MKCSVISILCVLLSLLTLIGSTGCSMYGERKKATPAYMEKRREIMSAPRPEGSEDYPIHTALIDVDEGDHVKTVACSADGSVSLYLSTGEAYEQLHLKDAALSQKALDFLTGMGTHIELAHHQLQTDLAPAEPDSDLLYLAADDGIHTLTVLPAYVSGSSEAAQEIYGLYRALYEAVLAVADTGEGT